MRLQSNYTILLLPIFLITTIAMPIVDSADSESTPASPIHEARGNKDTCQKTSAQNICTSGEPYCCSGSGRGHTCSKSQVDCSATTICCNNFNGMQICAGEIDFTGAGDNQHQLVRFREVMSNSWQDALRGAGSSVQHTEDEAKS